MRIGIDARFYGPKGKGLGRYVQKLIQHLEVIDHNNEYVIFLRRENFNEYVPNNPHFRKVLADFRWYTLAEQIGMPRVLHRERCDLVHFPHYNVPLLYRQPFVVTIHDLILSHFPTRRASTLGPVLYALKHAAYVVVIRSAIKRAQSVLTVSEYSKKVIMEEFYKNPAAIVVTYEAADPLPAEDTVQAQRVPGLGHYPYMLYVGNAYPHKNLEMLVTAFAHLRKTHADVHLVLVGKMDYFYNRLASLVRERRMSDVVHFPGFVTDQQLATLYHDARAYVFPSYEEGFGLPPLEAMQAGIPVASSNASCMPEILGDAAAYFDPKQETALVGVLEHLLTDDGYWRQLQRKGFERAAQFSWRALAQTTLNVYTDHAHTRHEHGKRQEPTEQTNTQ